MFFEDHYLWSSYWKFKGNNMGEDSSSCQAEKNARNLLGQNRSFHKGIDYTLCTIQQTLDTLGIYSLCDMGETGQNKISFLHRLRKYLYTHWTSS